MRRHRGSNMAGGVARGGNGRGSLTNARRGYPSGGGGGNSGGDDTYVRTVGYERPPGAAQKVGNSLAGLLMGPVVVFFGCLLLWYNEEWAVRTHRSLNEALDAYVAVDDADDGRLADEYRGRLVHLTHMLSADGVTDPMFDLSRRDAVSLNRNVEIYQWVESIRTKRVKKGKETEVQEVVNYNKKWVNAPVDSTNFRHRGGHENCCGDLPMPSESFRAAQVKMGAYRLGNALTRQLNKSNGVPSSEVKTLPRGAQRDGNAIYLPRGGEQAALPPGDDLSQGIKETTARIDGEERTMFLVKATGESFSTREKAMAAAKADELSRALEEKTMRIDGEEKTMFLVKTTGESFSTREKALAAARAVVPSQRERRVTRQTDGEAEIGDVRIAFSEVRCALVSVLAKLSESGNMLTNWQSRQGAGYDVAVLSYGAVSAADMIGSAQTANMARTWIFRFGGWLLNLIGFGMITSIVSTTADITLNWIPLLGPMANSLIKLGVSVANLIFATCTAMLVASIAWVFYRPLLGISLLAGSLGLFYTASQAGKGRGTSIKAQRQKHQVRFK